MEHYRLHIFVCLGKRCSAKGAEDVLDRMKEKIKGAGLKSDVRVSRSGCLQVCKETASEGEHSPAIVIYPEGVWYRNVTVSDVDEIVDRHVRKGETVERLLHYRMTL